MKFVANKFSISALIVSAAILVGCGGGGGGSTTPATLAAVTITSTNAPDVAANAVSASNGISPSGGATSLITGVTVNSPNTVRFSLLDASLQQIYTAIENQPAANLVSGVTTSYPNTPCRNGGSMSISITTSQSSGVLSAGDSMSITTSNCVQGPTTMNGELHVTFSKLSGIPGTYPWSGTLAMTFKDMKIATGSDTEQFNGDMTVSVTQRAALDMDAAISGNSLRLVLLSNGTTVLDRTLSAYAYQGTVKSNLETYTDNFTVSGNLKNAGTGSLTVTTTTLFQQFSGAYPHLGALKVVGAGNTSLTLTALDNTNVRLDIDKSGDGVTDDTVNTTWAALAAKI